MKKAFFFLHISILLAGLTGIFGKLIILNEVFITFYRMLLSAIILLLIGLFYRKAKKKLSPKDILKIGGVGLLLGVHWIFFYGSIKYSNISVGVVCFCLTSFFTAFLEPILNRRKISASEILLSLLVLLGIGVIFSFDITYRLGILLGIISSFLVAFYTIFNERLLRKHDVYSLTTIEMLGGTVGIGVLLPLILHFYPADYIIPSLSDFVYLLILSGACTILLYVLVNVALKYISAFTVNLSFNLEPIYTIIIAILFFDEYNELNASFFIGLTLILSSLLLQMLRVLRGKRRK